MTFTNSSFVGNTADEFGGVVAVGPNSDAFFESSVLVENSAGEEGGAIWIFVDEPLASGDGEPFINLGGAFVDDSVFDGNSAKRGGAVSNGSQFSVSDSRFTNNIASEDGGAIYVNTRDGAADPRPEVDLFARRSTFDANTAGNRGGAVFAKTELGSVLLGESTVSSNSATTGGGIYFDLDGTPEEEGRGGERAGRSTISGSTVVENSASGVGGGVYVLIANMPELDLDGNIIASNTASSSADLQFSAGPLAQFSEGLRGNIIGRNPGSGLDVTGTSNPDADGNFVGSSSSPIDPALTSLVTFSPTIAAPFLSPTVWRLTMQSIVLAARLRRISLATPVSSVRLTTSVRSSSGHLVAIRFNSTMAF